MQHAGAEIGQRSRQHEEVPHRLTLVEGVREDGQEERRHEPAVAEPHDRHRHQQDVEHRQHVDPPPTVPATLVDDAQQRIPDQRRGEHRRDHGQRHLVSPEEPADDADHEQTDRDDPPPPVAAPERLEVLEALLQRRSVVRPTAQAGGQGQARVERGEGHRSILQQLRGAH